MTLPELIKIAGREDIYFYSKSMLNHTKCIQIIGHIAPGIYDVLFYQSSGKPVQLTWGINMGPYDLEIHDLTYKQQFEEVFN